MVGALVAGVLGAGMLITFAAHGWIDRTWKQINAVATPLLAYTAAGAWGGRQRLHPGGRAGRPLPL
jgi:hypothetical protein